MLQSIRPAKRQKGMQKLVPPVVVSVLLMRIKLLAVRFVLVIYLMRKNLQKYHQHEPLDFRQLLESTLALVSQLKPLKADVSAVLADYRKQGKRILFEGAQGTLLDVDHGTYPFVTSSNTVAGAASIGTGMGPRFIDYILGVTKAYTTRVGSGPFPTELKDDIGKRLAERGNEFGSNTGRPRRCGWLDMVVLRRSNQLNSFSGLCVTKLDVLDGLETVRVCTHYELNGKKITELPTDAADLEACKPIYEELPGWSESTLGVKSFEKLPKKAQKFLLRIEELAGVPIDIISTGPDRTETMLLRQPLSQPALEI